jgi:methyl-accepting chemotaxis protein
MVTAAAVLSAGAAAWLALAGNLNPALSLTGVAVLLVAVLHALADRRSVHAQRRALAEIRALSDGLGSLSEDVTTQSASVRERMASLHEGLGSLSEKTALLSDSVTQSAERARRQAEGAERRLLASVDAARLEAAGGRPKASPTT